MSSKNPTQFQARIYPTQTETTHVSLTWRKGNKLLCEKLSFEGIMETKEVDLSDGKEYIISYSGKRKEKVKVSLVKDFKVTPCIVTIYERESVELV